MWRTVSAVVVVVLLASAGAVPAVGLTAPVTAEPNAASVDDPTATTADGSRATTAEGSRAASADGSRAVTTDGSRATTAEGSTAASVDTPSAVQTPAAARQEATAGLDQNSYTATRGDVVAFTVTTSGTNTATATIGSPADGYEVDVTVRTGGSATVRLNTYAAAEGRDAISVENGDLVDVAVDTASVGTLVAGTYNLSVRAGANATGPPDALAALTLRERATRGATAWTAPEAVDFSAPEDVREAILDGRLTRTNRTAASDHLVIAWNASGVDGLLAAQETGLPEPTTTDRFLAALGGTEPAVAFGLVQRDPPVNRDPIRLGDTLDRETLTVVEREGTVYLVIDLHAVDAPTDEGFRASITLREAGTAERFAAGDETVHENVTITPVRISVATGTIRAASDQSVRGTTTLAPGTELSLRLVSRTARPKFVKPATVTVTANRTFRATYDLSQQAGGVPRDGTRVRAIARVDNVTRVESDLQLRRQPTPTPTATTTPTPTATPTPTVTPNGTATLSPTPGERTPTAAALTPELQVNVTDTIATETDTPGFTLPLAVAALLLCVARLRR